MGLSGQAVRLQRVHDAAAAGPHGSGCGRAAVCRCATGQRPRCRVARRRRARGDAGGGVDVSLQQPHGAAGAAAAAAGEIRRLAARAVETGEHEMDGIGLGRAIGFAFLAESLQGFLGRRRAPPWHSSVAAPVGMWPRVWKLMVGAARLHCFWRAATWRWSACGLLTRGATLRVDRPQPRAVTWATTAFSACSAWRNAVAAASTTVRRPAAAPAPDPAGPGQLLSGGDPGIGRMFGMSMDRGVVAIARRARRPGRRTVAGPKAGRTDRARASLPPWVAGFW